MRQFPRIDILISAGAIDGSESGNVVVKNGPVSLEMSTLEYALDVLPPGSQVNVIATGQVDSDAALRLSRIISGSHVLVALDLSAVTELSPVANSPFEGNCQLLSIRFPENVASLTPGAFAGCTALASAVIPAGVRRVGAQAFSGCVRLAWLEFRSAEGWLCDDGAGGMLPAGGLGNPAETPALFSPPDGRYTGRTLYKADAGGATA